MKALNSAAPVWLRLPKGDFSDVLLAVGVIAIIGLMILPLPALVIDALVAVNILFGIGLLLLAIYIPRPTAFSSFPSVLLLSTLFRLALSIAITKMILLHAHAGNIVETFGKLVVGGNLVVGIVVFLIITVVQFIVVAKGAERVAEVAARFTLDAMPGKQLSIDSDLRSGLLDKDEARRRRRLLEVESQLHGSLDGAMKFVKGDAIAGIVIIIINILGGLAIGVLQRDMPLGLAAHTYSILTIGDGLVAQIPALLCSISAGLVVTRSAGEEDDKNLGVAISRQIGSQPRVALIGGALALMLALIPGFPWPVFVVLGLTLLASWTWRARNRHEVLRRLFRVPEPDPLVEQARADALRGELAPPPPLLLEINPQTLQELGYVRVEAATRTAVARVRERFGVPLPAPTVRAGLALAPGQYGLVAHGMRLARGAVRAQAHFLPQARDATQEAVAAPEAGVPATTAAPTALAVFWPPMQGEWLPADADADADGARSGIRERALDACEVLERHLEVALHRQLGLFLGIQETANLIQRWGREYPDLIKEMLRVVPPQRVSEVLRRLVEEGVPIRNLRDVFEAITEAGAREKDIVMLTEYVRVALRRQISDHFTDGTRSLHALLAHPELEDLLRQSVRGGGGANQIAIDPQTLNRILQDIQQARQRLGDGFAGVALLSSLDVRRHLRRLIENEFFALPVLSFQELVGDVRVVPEGQVKG